MRSPELRAAITSSKVEAFARYPHEMPVACARLLIVLLCVGALCLAAAVPAWANDAEEQLGAWTGVQSNVRLTRRWSGFLQGEVRTWDLAANLNETLVRAAAQFDVTPSFMVGLGYVRADTWGFDASFGARKRGEDRFYQELRKTHPFGRLTLQHRVRIEQRWFRENGRSTMGNRGRYFIGATLPVTGRKIVPGSTFLRATNEIFLNYASDAVRTYPDRADVFDQNRLYLGVGRQFTKDSNLQVGLLWQARTEYDFFRIVITYTHNFDLRG